MNADAHILSSETFHPVSADCNEVAVGPAPCCIIDTNEALADVYPRQEPDIRERVAGGMAVLQWLVKSLIVFGSGALTAGMLFGGVWLLRPTANPGGRSGLQAFESLDGPVTLPALAVEYRARSGSDVPEAAEGSAVAPLPAPLAPNNVSIQ